MVPSMDASALLTALNSEDSSLRKELCELLVDYHLEQPLARYIGADEIEQLIRQLLSPAAVQGHLNQYLIPIVERSLATMAARNQPLGVWVEPQLRAQAVKMLTRPGGPRFAYMEGAISPTLLRNLLSPVFQEVLLSFTSRLTSSLGIATGAGGAGTDSRLLGRLGREVGDRGRRWAEFGRNLMGGLGLEEKLGQLAGEFSQQAVTTFRTHLGERLQSQEGQALLRELVDQVLDRLLRAPMAEVQKDCERIPLPELMRLHPGGLAHAVAQPLFDVLLRDEVKRFAQEQSPRPLRDLLADFGLQDEVRQLALTIVQRGADDFLSSDAFARFMDQWTRRATDAT